MAASSLPNIIAIDLGAESCRVSLLRREQGTARIDLIHRFSNAPLERNGSLAWDLDRILAELEKGMLRCADLCGGPIASIGVDGWAVDYVRIDGQGMPLGAPYCYRDPRTEAALEELHQRCSAQELYAESGAWPLRINTVYQLLADKKAGIPDATRWVNLPEYVLGRMGGRFVAEFTNATHTGLVDIRERVWSQRLFARCGLDIAAAPELVSTGTEIGMLQGPPSERTCFRDTRLIATACHDTASAVAGIPLDGDNWAYISSGTWSLVGTLLDAPVTTAEACAAGFTNQGAAGNRVCFHKNVNGMWLLKQTLEQLCPNEDAWTVPELVAAAETLPASDHPLDVDDPELLLAGGMASRINAQRAAHGLPPIPEHGSAMPQFANLIFHSLAARYAEVLGNAQRLTGKTFAKVAIVGGGSRNRFLNRLTAEATGLEVYRGVAESSTIGNFAIQLATLEGCRNSRTRIAHWARVLTEPHAC